MSEEKSAAALRAEARKKKILNRAENRLAVAKGDAPSGEGTKIRRPLAARKAKELNISEGKDSPADSIAESESTDNVNLDTSTEGAETPCPEATPDDNVQKKLDAQLQERKKIEQEIIRLTEEFDKKQLSGKEKQSSETEETPAVEHTSDTDSDSVKEAKEVKNQSGDAVQLVPSQVVDRASAQLKREDVVHVMRLLVTVLLALFAGYNSAIETLVFRTTYPSSYESTYIQPESEMNARSRLLQFTSAEYIHDQDQTLSSSWAGVFWIMLHHPVIAVGVAYVLGSWLASSSIVCMMLGLRMVEDQPPKSIVAILISLAMGDYSGVTEGLLNIGGQIAVHIVVAFTVASVLLFLASDSASSLLFTFVGEL